MTLLLLFLLTCAAVYLTAIEAAFGALLRLSLRLAAERAGRSDAVAAYVDDPPRLFVPLRLALAIVTAAAMVLLVGGVGLADAHAVMFVAAGAVVFVVAELLAPILVAGRDPEAVLEMLLPPFAWFVRLLEPITRRTTRFGSAGRRASAGPREDAETGRAIDETGSAEGRPDGIMEGEERRLLRSIVEFGGTLVREVMTPRPDVVAVDEGATVADLRALFREQEYSRFPVFRESLDNIVGFVFVKDLVALDTADEARQIRTLLRPAVVVPESKRVHDLLRQFQRQQTQIAIVVDEYGGTAGLVTIEDMLEEIVGEIRDEYDVESEAIVDEGGGQFVVSGKVDIDEVNQRLGAHIERDGFETLGGYLLTRLGRVPAVGERLDVGELSVSVLEVERRRVHKVRIARREGPAAPGDGA